MPKKKQEPEPKPAVNPTTEAIHAFKYAQERSAAFWNNHTLLQKRLRDDLGIYENTIDLYVSALYLFRMPSFAKTTAARWNKSVGFKEGYDVASAGKLYGLEYTTYDRWLGWMCSLIDSGKIPLPPYALREHYIRSACAFPPHPTEQ